MEITYLLNSGFLIRFEKILLVFDDYADPTNEVQKALDENFDRLYIFASHSHADHFDLHILDYADKVEKYIFSYDIRRHRKRQFDLFPSDKIVLMNRYDSWQDDSISVQSFDSTDLGLSYSVEFADGFRIFHAGDFNFWYWSGDTEENRLESKILFETQMKKIAGLKFDVAFFPVDGRLGRYNEAGAREFFKQTDTRYLISMHNVGFSPWIPSQDFFGSKNAVPVWSPNKSGDHISI